jgi:hypothetical protein
MASPEAGQAADQLHAADAGPRMGPLEHPTPGLPHGGHAALPLWVLLVEEGGRAEVVVVGEGSHLSRTLRTSLRKDLREPTRRSPSSPP